VVTPVSVSSRAP